jgi:hypothetical protein
MSGKIIWIFLGTAVIGTLFASDNIERNGNVNVNVIDRKVIVNGKVVKTIPKGEPIDINLENGEVRVGGKKVNSSNSRNNRMDERDGIGADIGNIGASIDGDKIGANIGRDIGAKIDGDSISANVGGISASIDGDKIKANIGSIINSAIKRRKDRGDKKDDSDFFDGDDFFK